MKKAFSEFLQAEISHEGQRAQKPPVPAGWSAHTDGALCVMKRVCSDKATIELSFTVAGTVEPADLKGAPKDATEKEEKASAKDAVKAKDVKVEKGERDGDVDLRAMPQFLIRVTKPSGRMVELQCSWMGSEHDEDDDDGIHDMQVPLKFLCLYRLRFALYAL